MFYKMIDWVPTKKSMLGWGCGSVMQHLPVEMLLFPVERKEGRKKGKEGRKEGRKESREGRNEERKKGKKGGKEEKERETSKCL
jgi:hypothetical protein